ncbi:MAG: hypothetical protein HKN58_06790 [Xanthomonadales bacterium]|nr:hypothetical protein [Xanthomonadales bacterium]
MKDTISMTLAALVFITGAAFAQVGNNPSVLNPNLASASEISALPGMNPTLVEKIIEKRPLASTGEIDSLLHSRLDPDAIRALHEKLFVPLNLNSASREEIMLIPGMTRRMAHEFEEYRPYTSLEQFRREIGKYVDANEVARLEQFVFVPLDLNSASSEELATIPGISPRMVHEFEEYRPYSDMQQFRREIGKYVDPDEVARLERYVEIR